MAIKELRARFLAAIEKTETCWNWTAMIDKDGYGRITVNGRWERAPRVSYQLFVGAIPAGLELDHLCRNRRCVNPHHLEPVTRAENLMRMFEATGVCGGERAAGYALGTHCRNGHEFDQANTYMDHGRRTCRACNAAAARRYKARKKREQP